MRRERLRVVANEPVGPYRLAAPRACGRWNRACRASSSWSRLPAACCHDPSASASRRRVSSRSSSIRSVRGHVPSASVSRPATRLHVLGPLGNGFDLDVRAAAARRRRDRRRTRSRFSPSASVAPPAILGFRTAQSQAEAAVLVPNAEVVLEPTLVTEAMPADPGDVLACGPEAMLVAVARARAPRAARVGGTDGLRLRRLLRLRGRSVRAPA